MSGAKPSVVSQEFPEQLKLDNQLCFLLYSSSRAMTKLYRPLLSEIGLTYPQYLVMLVLWQAESERKRCAIGDLCDALYLDTGTLTPLLKRLEQQDYIIRQRAKDDERRVDVMLTDQGKALQRQAELIPEQMLCRAQSVIRKRHDLDDKVITDKQQLMGHLKALLSILHSSA